MPVTRITSRSRSGLATGRTLGSGRHMNASHESKHLWVILKPPEFEKVYRIYLLPGSGLKRQQLTNNPAYESWQFERPIDFLNWLEQKLQAAPKPGGLR
jgi:hypothetical protein